MHFGRLGGFHFNGSMYGDDDLTTGSIKPYQFFLIFNELVDAMNDPSVKNPPLAWMIDASHNSKDPLEDLMQSVQNILTTYAKALLVDRAVLAAAQDNNDVLTAEELLRDVFATDTCTGLGNKSGNTDEIKATINSNFNIYPNPSNGNFNIYFDNSNESYCVEIYSLIGEKVFDKKNTNAIESVSNLQKGIYLIKVSNGNESITKKIIIN